MKLLLTSLTVLGFALSCTADDKKITVGEFTFTVPAPWTEGQPTGMFDKAALNYPSESGTPVVAKFSEFPGGGGGIEANVKRWVGQFEGGSPEQKREDLTFGDVQVVLLTLTGTFLDGPPMSASKTPRPDYQMLGAILMGKEVATFIKFTGPKADVAKAADAFKKLATSPFPAKS